jgi:hypothetical protein
MGVLDYVEVDEAESFESFINSQESEDCHKKKVCAHDCGCPRKRKQGVGSGSSINQKQADASTCEGRADIFAGYTNGAETVKKNVTAFFDLEGFESNYATCTGFRTKWAQKFVDAFMDCQRADTPPRGVDPKKVEEWRRVNKEKHDKMEPMMKKFAEHVRILCSSDQLLTTTPKEQQDEIWWRFEAKYKKSTGWSVEDLRTPKKSKLDNEKETPSGSESKGRRVYGTAAYILKRTLQIFSKPCECFKIVPNTPIARARMIAECNRKCKVEGIARNTLDEPEVEEESEMD